MDQREKELRENYEDALFVLWMDMPEKRENSF